MDRRHVLSMMGLLAAAALAFGAAQPVTGWFQSSAEDRLPKPPALCLFERAVYHILRRCFLIDLHR